MSDQKQPWPDLTEKCLATEPEAVGELLTCTDERLAELIREVRDAPDGNYPDEIRRKDACLSALSELLALRRMGVEKDAERYRWLRSQTRAAFADTAATEPQLIYKKRSDPFIKGYAKRVDDAIDAAIASLPLTERGGGK